MLHRPEPRRPVAASPRIVPSPACQAPRPRPAAVRSECLILRAPRDKQGGPEGPVKDVPKKHRPRRAARRSKRLGWIAGAGVLALILYGLSQVSSVAYTDKDIRVVDFSSLDRRQKNAALEEANRERCICGCGMTLAQCVATDSTCPLRDGNVAKVRAMVTEAGRPTS